MLKSRLMNNLWTVNRLTARLSLERERGDDVMMTSAELGITGLMLGH